MDRFDFHQPMTAFAFDTPFFDDFGCPGNEPPTRSCPGPPVIHLNFGSDSFDIYALPFFGVVLDAPISSFEITSAYEVAYHLDNMRWAPVPEPTTGLLVIAGLLGLAASRRDRAGRLSFQS
jgi:PEP-CTERM motif-containing protein